MLDAGAFIVILKLHDSTLTAGTWLQSMPSAISDLYYVIIKKYTEKSIKKNPFLPLINNHLSSKAAMKWQSERRST